MTVYLSRIDIQNFKFKEALPIEKVKLCTEL